MIERYVFIKLKDAHATPTGRAELVEETKAKLPGLPGVLGVTVGTPADKAADDIVERTQTHRVARVHELTDGKIEATGLGWHGLRSQHFSALRGRMMRLA